MGTRLFVGNLSYTTTEDALREAFAADGRAVVRVRVMLDRETGRPRGFAFVDMANESDAEAAVRALDGTRLDGRPLRVDIASDREPGRGDARPGPRPERAAGPRAQDDAPRELRPVRESRSERPERPGPERSAAPARETRQFGPDRAPWRNDDRRRGGERKRGGRSDERGGEDRGLRRGGRRPQDDDDDDFDDDWS